MIGWPYPTSAGIRHPFGVTADNTDGRCDWVLGMEFDGDGPRGGAATPLRVFSCGRRRSFVEEYGRYRSGAAMVREAGHTA